MTISTKTKKKGPSGPIRTGVVIPSLILATLLGVYFSYFFDNHLRRTLEYVGTQVNGAEVNVGRVSISFLHANLEIEKIQVTDKNHPERNIVQIGKIHFKLLWDALLRAKGVIENASILDIQALTPRKKPGYVVPPPPPDISKSSSLAEVESAVVNQAKKQFNDNFLGDIANVVGGADPKEQLKSIQAELKSDARIKVLQKEFDEKRVIWEKRIKDLPQTKDLKEYEARIKALKFDMKNPAEFAKNVQEADKIIKEANEKVKQIDQAQKDLKTDSNTYTQAIKDLEKMIQEDIRDLQGKLKIPSLDPKEFSQQIFMGMVAKKLGSLVKYVELGRRFAPPPKTAAEKQAQKDAQIVPTKRGTGKTFRFPVTKGYPLFWLKYAAISSKSNDGEYSGDIKGEVKDVTTSPAQLGRPTLILIQGNFPKQGIGGLDAKITLDHTTEVARETMLLKIASFPVANAKLSDSPDVRLALAKATGSSDINAVFTNSELKMSMKNSFGDIKYDLEAKNKMVHEIIAGVLNEIPTITLNADIKGSLSNPSIGINSNLGDELSEGFQKVLQAKIAEAKAQLQAMIDEKITQNRNKLKAEVDKVTGDASKLIGGRKADAEKVIKDAEAQLKSGKDSGGTKKLEQEGKKLLNKFLGG